MPESQMLERVGGEVSARVEGILRKQPMNHFRPLVLSPRPRSEVAHRQVPSSLSVSHAADSGEGVEV